MKDNNVTVKYMDGLGRLVLERKQVNKGTSIVNMNDGSISDDINFSSTYYVYDSYGSLAVVMTPEGTSRLRSEYLSKDDQGKRDFLNLWSFQYKYDARNRVVEKKLPSVESVYVVYDDRNRPVFTQDGNQRKLNQWSFTNYDRFNRPIISGLYTHGGPVLPADQAKLLNGPL